MLPSLYDISWKVDEPTYRADKALSYSTLARFAREGFNKLHTLFDRIETPSLTFGSAVDAIITGGQKEFNDNFIVAEFPPIKDSIIKVVKEAFDLYSTQYSSLIDIPDNLLSGICDKQKFQPNWKPETRVRVVKEQGLEYYSLLYIAREKKIIDTETKNQVDAAVRALKESPGTKYFFEVDSPFVPTTQRYYQLKFKATFNNIKYRCMPDELLVDHANKTITPIDLKTSSHPEWDFAESFVQWKYDIQARLYWRIIRENLDESPQFKDYTLANYRFVVVNKETLIPLVWVFEQTQTKGTLVYGKNKQIEMEDPFAIGKRLSFYLNNNSKVPEGITIKGENSLNKLYSL